MFKLSLLRPWMALALIGALFTGWGLHQVFVIPGFDASHWDWLAPHAPLLDYIKFWFRLHGLWTAAYRVAIGVIAARGLALSFPFGRRASQE